MLRGTNVPYDWRGTDDTYSDLDLAGARECVVIASHEPRTLYQELLDRFAPKLWIIRAKTGPQHTGSYPDNIWTYDEGLASNGPQWGPTLSETVQWCLAHGITPWVLLGNEPELELVAITDDPATWNDAALHAAAIEFYEEWYLTNARRARLTWGDRVKLAPAPPAQGNPERTDRWLSMYGRLWASDLCDFVADHNYTNGYGFDHSEWGGRHTILRGYGKPVDLTEINDNGALRAEPWGVRGAHLGHYLGWLAEYPYIRSASLYTVRGGAQDRYKPDWHFWGNAELGAAAEIYASRIYEIAQRQPTEVAEVPLEPSTPENRPESPPDAADSLSGDPWGWWTPEEMAQVLKCPQANIEMHWPNVVYALTHLGIGYDVRSLAAIAATIAVETAYRFEPIDEFRMADGSEPDYWADYSGGSKYHGRGLGQITHDYNYRALGDFLGIDLVAAPERALEPSIAAWGVAKFWLDHGLTEVAQSRDWTKLRRIYQGGNRGLDEVAARADGLLALVDFPREEPELAPDPSPAPPFTPKWTYSPDLRPVYQTGNWQCSAASTAWALQSVGLSEWNQDAVAAFLGPSAINPDVGLVYGDGRELVALLARLIAGAEVTAKWGSWLTLTLAAAEQAGPMLMGGQSWYHWTAIRGYDPSTAELLLANPAPNWQGVGQRMDEAEFNRLGAFRVIQVRLPSDEAEDPEMIAELQAELQARNGELAGLRSTLGYLTVDVARAYRDAVNRLGGQTIRPRFTKAQITKQLGELTEAVASATNTLEAHRP